MSRFWAGNASSDSGGSSASSSDDSSSASDASGNNANNANNRWVALSESSDSSDDQARVVKSGQERALEAFQTSIRKLQAAMRARDYYALQTEFDVLAKSMIKYKQYLVEGVPKPLVKILVDVQDYVTERLLDKAQFQHLSARQGRSLNKMKLTMKKHNQAYQAVIAEYRKNPIVDVIVSDDDSESSDDDDASAKSSGSDSDDSSSKSSSSSEEDKSKGSDDSDDDDDDSNDDDASWASGSDSSSSSDDEDAGAYAQLKGRARWLKKNTVSKEKVVKNKDERAKQRAEAREKALLATAAKEAVTATKSILPEEGLTASLLERKVKELAAQRGRKNKDNRAILRQLEALSRLSLKFGPRVEVPILMQVIAAEFGLLRTMDDYMDIATWKSCASYLERVADVLEEGYTLGVEMVDEAGLFLTSKGEATSKMKATAKATDGAMAAFSADEKLVNPHTGEVETEDERAERQRVEKEATLTEEEKKVINVVGSLSLHMSRLEEEYTKSLQKISQHSPEYIARLRDECKLVELLSRFQNYFEAQGSDEEAAMLAQLRIEHIYYRHDTIAIQVDKAALFYKQHGEVDMLHPGCIFSEKPTGSQLLDFTQIHPGAAEGTPVIDDPPVVNYGSIMAELCEYVYKHGTEQAKIRATICHIYHHALHDRFVDARDLLLMSHLQDTIYGCDDVITMVLYNRMMANVGMCAFRVGRIYDAHQCLSEICSGRVRELLAQGVQSGRFHNDKTADQEKAEKRRQVPYHQHINLDLLDACHLISAMLLEVPNMAEAAAGSSRRYQRTLSRNFRKLVDQYNHQVFTGPPEQTRDFVMSATKALMKGDWVTCSDLLMNLDVWQLVPGDNATQEIGAMLIGKIKLEALRTYLFAFSKQYQSLSLNVLTAMFDMTKNEVHSVVSKMIINRELGASWDQPTETIVLRKSDPSPLQILSLQLAEKTAHLVESNERLLDAQSGNHGFKEEWKDGDEHHRWHNRGDRGGRGGGGGYRGNVGGRGRGGGGNDRGGRGGGNDRGGRGGGNDRNSGGRGGRGRSGGGRGGGRGRKY